MQDIDGISDVAIDTTARGFFRSARKSKGLETDLTAALKKLKLKLKDVVPSSVAKPLETYVIDVKGLG